jgi:hypothetical protein
MDFYSCVLFFFVLGDHWIEIATVGENGSVNEKEKERDWIDIVVAVTCGHHQCVERLVDAGKIISLYLIMI